MDDKIITDLIKIMPLMHRKFFHNMRRQDLKKNTMVLMSIYKHSGHTMTYYCDKLVISKPNFSKVINDFIDLGYVERKDDKVDRRKTNLFITEKGISEAKTREAILFKVFREQLEHFSKDELEELHEHVLGIHKILNRL